MVGNPSVGEMNINRILERMHLEFLLADWSFRKHICEEVLGVPLFVGKAKSRKIGQRIFYIDFNAKMLFNSSFAYQCYAGGAIQNFPKRSWSTAKTIFIAFGLLSWKLPQGRSRTPVLDRKQNVQFTSDLAITFRPHQLSILLTRAIRGATPPDTQ